MDALCPLWTVLALMALLGLFAAASAAPDPRAHAWVDRVLDVPYAVPRPPDSLRLHLLRQDFEELERNRSILKTPLAIGGRRFDRGLERTP